MPFGHLGNVDDGAEDTSIRLHGACAELQITRPMLGVDDHLIEIPRLTRVHDVLEDLMHTAPLGRRSETLHRRIDPLLRRHSAERAIEEDAAALAVEESEPIRGARRYGLQGHLGLAQRGLCALALSHIRHGHSERANVPAFNDRDDAMLIMRGVAVHVRVPEIDTARPP